MPSPRPAGAAPVPGDQGGVIELRGVSKRYGRVLANDDISVRFNPGEIHVVVGENGAGKSTMMGVLSGTVRPDSGTILLDGQEVGPRGARDATRQGIGMVHQNFQLVDVFTVAQNVALGFEPRNRFRTLDLDVTRAQVRDVSAEFGLALDPDAVVGSLPVGVRQRVEIVKVLVRQPRIIIFDEPTAVLTAEESGKLLAMLGRLREDGRSVVFITHKLREALAIADRITVLRRGRVVGRTEPGSVTAGDLGAMMVGRALRVVQRQPSERAASDGKPVLSVRGLRYTPGDLSGCGVHDIRFDVRPGEIFGLVGVDGNGQEELAGLITGALTPAGGSIRLHGQEAAGRPVRDFLARGVGIIPADRQRHGLAMGMPVSRNLILDRRGERQFVRARGLLINDRAVARHAEEVIEKFDIRADGPGAPASSLSGGNQQKVILARELERDIRLLVASQPTRGLDVGSIEYVHHRILAMARLGCAVVLVTSELDEALALCDRIAPLYEGRLMGIEDAPFDRNQIGLLMGGG